MNTRRHGIGHRRRLKRVANGGAAEVATSVRALPAHGNEAAFPPVYADGFQWI